MTLIQNSNGQPAIHALVIGIGQYPWLIGGDQKPFAQHGGMAQLTSAPESARSFASWFLNELHHPDIGQKTLDLLISDADDNTFDSEAGPIAIERATMGNAKQAINQWVARGDSDEDSILIFFFCGHGLGKGRQTILLMEDFGSVPNTNSLSYAIDFDSFYLGMDQCQARRQCYFVDACRVGTPFTLNSLTYFGDPVMIPAAKIANRTRSAPVYYSAMPGTAAYGQKDHASFFTSALINAFKGAGADDATGFWRVETEVLHRGIRAHLQRAFSGSLKATQTAIVDGMADSFTLHQLVTDPIVPVDVTCKLDEHNKTAQLNVTGGPDPMQMGNVPSGCWQLDLPLGTYHFAIALPTQTDPLAIVTKSIRPPYRIIEVPVL